MKWYRNLYLGEEAKKAKYKIFGKISEKRFTFDTYLIIISANPNNILDIISANEFYQPHFQKEYANDIYVVGLAKGKDEAFELVRQIIDETYSNSGNVDIATYLRFGSRIRD